MNLCDLKYQRILGKWHGSAEQGTWLQNLAIRIFGGNKPSSVNFATIMKHKRKLEWVAKNLAEILWSQMEGCYKQIKLQFLIRITHL